MNIRSLFLAFVLLALFPMVGSAQNGMEDAVYLNNGSVLRGIIIEQVPNRSLKVQILGGSIFHVEMVEVARITKEPIGNVPTVLRDAPQAASSRRDTLQHAPYEPKRKGYFFQAQLLLELVQGGVRVVNGYRFGRFGHLGVGLGLDLSGPGLSTRSNESYGNSYSGSGVYLPIYLQYSGEILKKRVTPFYALELGYAVAVTGSGMNEMDYGSGYGPDDLRGGAMWGLGIGVRFKTKKRLNFSLLLNVSAKNVSYREYYYYLSEVDQNYYTGSDRVHTTLVYPGLRLGIGF